MAMNDYASSPDAGGNPAMSEGAGGRCIEIYIGADGSMMVSESTDKDEPPEQGTPVASLDEALAKVREMVGQEAGDPMEAAQRGYKRMAPEPMKAPKPGLAAVFGED